MRERKKRKRINARLIFWWIQFRSFPFVRQEKVLSREIQKARL
jgi:hypothetical protein